jgi:hypothetical protein
VRILFFIHNAEAAMAKCFPIAVVDEDAGVQLFPPPKK